MGVIKTVVGLILLMAIVTQVLGWLLLWFLNSWQEKFTEKIRSNMNLDEFRSLKWDSYPKWARVEKIKNWVIIAILITGALILVSGFIANAMDGTGDCYGRFEDYCPAIE